MPCVPRPRNFDSLRARRVSPALAVGALVIWTAVLWTASAHSQVPRTATSSAVVTTPPSLDGHLEPSEWPLEHAVPFDQGDLVAVNDGIRLYLLVNLHSDSEVDDGDRLSVLLDVDGDGEMTPGVDCRVRLQETSARLEIDDFDASPSGWTARGGRRSSAFGGGFDAFFVDGSRRPGAGVELPEGQRHRVWELGIDLEEIGAQPGDSVGLRWRVESGSPAIDAWAPLDASQGAAGQFAQLTLFQAHQADVLDPFGGGPSVSDPPLEVTQAVQTIDNDLPLVSKKKTVARAYVSGGSLSFFTVELHGSRGGAPLSGSPLAQTFVPVLGTTREDLNHTANFLLPDSWPQGDVDFQVVVRDGIGGSDSSAIVPIEFTCKETPTYWIVPADVGTGVTPSNATITSWQDFLESAFPVPEVEWEQQASLGVVAEDDLIDELAEYHAAMLFAWLLGVLATQQEPFTFPDQIIGVVNGAVNAGGRSDPVWSSNGAGTDFGNVCWIDSNNNGREVGLSHEVIHNLDRDAVGTWGRHVSNACDGFAGGTDSSWPYADDGIHEVGFDTREPWNASGSPLTVIPEDFPGIMSRCKAEDAGYPFLQTPSRWISPYRWENLFDRFETLSPCLVPATNIGSLIARVDSTLYVAGQLRGDGTARLQPVFELPGVPDEQGRTGPYAVDVLGEAGEVLHRHRFGASFVDAEGESIPGLSFRFRLPARHPRDVRGLRLLHDGELLDRIVVSSNVPEVELEDGQGGDWSGERDLRWRAEDADGDPLVFRVLYTPDGGRWFPVASRVRGRRLRVDTDRLPGGSGGKFRVLVSDGFHTREAETLEPIDISDKPPQVTLRRLRRDSEVVAGELVVLRGSARDLEDGRLGGDRLRWSLDGRLVGIGGVLRLRMRAGEHEIRLTAIDSAGNANSRSLRLRVLPHETDEPSDVEFVRGDVDMSGVTEITDAIAALRYLFLGNFEPPCLDAVDFDDSGDIALPDAIRILIYLFRDAVQIPEPFPTCGVDPTSDQLGCRRFDGCAL